MFCPSEERQGAAQGCHLPDYSRLVGLTDSVPLLNPNGPCVFVRSKIECKRQPMKNGVTFWCAFRHVYTLQRCKVNIMIPLEKGRETENPP